MSVPKEKISELVDEYIKQGEIIKKAEEQQGFIRELVRNHIKENELKFFKDDNNVVLVNVNRRTSYDGEKLKSLLNEQQLKDVTKVTEFEVMKIMTIQSYENSKKYLEGK